MPQAQRVTVPEPRDPMVAVYTNWRWWVSLLMLAGVMAVVLPALYVLPSRSTTKAEDYARSVGVVATMLASTIGIFWVIEAVFFRDT